MPMTRLAPTWNWLPWAASGAQLQERGIRVHQQFDPLTRGHLAAGVMPLNRIWRRPAERLGQFVVQFGQFHGHGLGSLGVGR